MPAADQRRLRRSPLLFVIITQFCQSSFIIDHYASHYVCAQNLPPACNLKASDVDYRLMKSRKKPVPSCLVTFDDRFAVERAWGDAAKAYPPGADLVAKLITLTQKDFNSTSSLRNMSFADVLSEPSLLRNNPPANRAVLLERIDELIRVPPEERDIIAELLIDRAFEKTSWQGKHGDRWDDGFYVGRQLPPPKPVPGTFWEVLHQDDLLPLANVQQVATLIFLGKEIQSAQEALNKVKGAERDLAWYRNWRGLETPYVNARLVDRNNDSFQEPYIWDLEYTARGGWFIFKGEATFTLRIRERLYPPSQNAFLVTEYYFRNGAFWRWLWGFDIYIPICRKGDDANEQFVALLMVTTLTCDKRNKVQIILENQGNLKYWAENDPR